MRVVIAGGGSGGHIYPALSIARGLMERAPDTEVVYIGTNHGLERELVPRAGITLKTIHARGMLGRGLVGKVAGASAALWGLFESLRILRGIRPHVVIGTGGYVSGPVGMAASLARIPLVIQEQNVWPGLTNRMLGRRAQAVLVPYPEAIPNFPAGTHAVVAGNPVHITYCGTQQEARETLGLDPDAVFLMVTGGSQGAFAINQFVGQFLPKLLANPDWGLLWATGKRYYHEVTRILADVPLDPKRIRLVEYFYDIQQVYRAADVFFGRAGAMTLADCAAFGLPSVLVPSPHVSEDHQTQNARVFESRGAGMALPEKELRSKGALVVTELLQDPTKRQDMAHAARGLFDAEAEARILDTILGAVRLSSKG